MNYIVKLQQLITLLLLCTLISACSSSPTKPLIGSWQLISEEIRFGDQSFSTFDADKKEMIKIFNHSHFSFTSISKERDNIRSYQLSTQEKVSIAEQFGGGSGRYNYENGILTEKIAHMNYANYQGVNIDFKITFKGDLLIQEGNYPLVKLGLGTQDGYLYSVFKRLP